MEDERERANHIARCFVFGDDIGQRVKCIRKAWDTAVLKAHGHRPVWVGSNTLSLESRATLRAIDLHFHDLRHEAGSRLHEAGWPLHHVQHMLGHRSLEQTTTYLNVTLAGLEESMRKFDEGGRPLQTRCKRGPGRARASLQRRGGVSFATADKLMDLAHPRPRSSVG